MSHPLRPRFEEALEDVVVLFKEFLLVVWRFNPAGVAFHTCHQMVAGLNDSTPDAERARIVAEGIGAIEIVPVETFEADVAKNIGEVTAGLMAETIAGPVKQYPEIEGFLRDTLGSEDAALAAAFSRMTLNAVAKHRATYQLLHAHYNQLVESLSRYTSIMNRSGLLQGVIAFAAGFFGGPVAGWGADAWNNWRTSNDQEFCQKFSAAFDQFVEACQAYTVAGEQSLSVVYDRLMDELRTHNRRLFDCYEQLAEEGWDIEPLYRSYTTADEPLTEDGRHLFEITIANLEENPAIHFRRIENMRRMVGIEHPPAPPTEAIPASAALAPAVPRPIVAPLAPPEPREPAASAPPLPVAAPPASPQEPAPPVAAAATAPLDADRVRSCIGGFACNQFYVTPDIPLDKAQRAIGSYAPHLKPADILLLCDTTLFATGTAGFLLTASSLHWRNAWDEARCVAFADISSVTVKPTNSIFSAAKVNVNGMEIDLSLGDGPQQNQIMRCLEATLNVATPSGSAASAAPARSPQEPTMQFGDSIRGQCAACGKGYVAAASNRGLSTPCQKCGKTITIGG